MPAHCLLDPGQVQEIFLAAPPLIAESILDLTVKHPNWMRDMFQVEEWPRGNGTIMEQLVFRGSMPQIERGLDQWKKLQNNTGCAPCSGPDCSYNWSNFGGNGWERKITELMSREFRSNAYCIAEIQTSAHFEEVFAKIVENLYREVDFFKEINIGQNVLTMLAKKYVVDSGGAKPNPENPYVYRNVGTATLSSLNITMLEHFYEFMRRLPTAVPYDVINGSPVFALEASHQILAHLYRDDPQLRQDVRFSGLANDALLKYNFMSTIRGMFIAAPILYPRRFVLEGVAGVPVEVLPFVNNVPAEYGSYTDFNPLYETATHEEILIHGKYPFKIFQLPTENTLGQNTSFGPEPSLFNSWQWVNPQTVQDPFRRVGYFATSAKIGISQQYSEAIYGILVPRPPRALMVSFFPAAVCPPDDVDCDNVVPDAGCPCPLILGVTQNPITATNYFFQLATPTEAVAEDLLQLGIDNGSYLEGEVAAVSSDGLTVEVTFGVGTDLGDCDHFTTIFCNDTLGCSSAVLSFCEVDATHINVSLKNPIKAITAADSVLITYADGSTATVTVTSAPDFATNTWHLTVPSYNACTEKGIVSICVPTATDASCPDCGGPTYTQCAT